MTIIIRGLDYMNIKRTLNLTNLLKNKSFFLFGPRATGKTFLINQQVSKNALIINLLNSEIYLQLSASPHDLVSMIDAEPSCKLVVIDEIQRVPMLLNEVHSLIEERGLKFLLTGSSARKLKRGSANLLAGRAWEARLFPFTSHELPKFDLEKYLLIGGLPSVYFSAHPNEELFSYVGTYLKEEIQAESLVRKLPAFSRFLQMSALTNGQMLNFSNIASDVGMPAVTVREYYTLLEDTFIGFMLPAYTKTKKRKAISTAKFYYFDIGVRNTLAGVKNIGKNTEVYGQLFEHFIVLELRAYLSYQRIRKDLSYWQSKGGQEVDIIVGDELAIEVKSSKKIMEKHLKSIKVFSEEEICERYIVVSHDKVNRRVGNIDIMYWKDFLEKLWSDELIAE